MKATPVNQSGLPEQSYPSGRRLYFLDNLRTLIILLVVVFHAAWPYSIYFSKGWYVADPRQSLFFDILIMSLYAFLMPVIFLIAGYFGIRSLACKGQLKFWRDKFLHIVIPWVLGVILVAPAIAYSCYFSRHLHPPAFFHFWWHTFWRRNGSFNYLERGQGPIYFLGVLTLFYAVLSLLYQVYKPLGNIRDKPKKTSGFFLIIFGLATGLIFFGGNRLINEGAFVHFGVFYVPATRMIPYLCYFFLGIFAYRQQWFAASGQIPKLKLGILFLALMLTFSKEGIMPEKIRMACYALSYYFFCLAAVLALLRIFQKRVNFTTKLLSSLAGNSYAIYFIHMLFVLPLNILVLDLPWNVFIKYIVVGILAVYGSFLASRYGLGKLMIFGGKTKQTRNSVTVRS